MLFSSAPRHVYVETGMMLALGEPAMAFALRVLVVKTDPGLAAFADLALVMGST